MGERQLRICLGGVRTRAKCVVDQHMNGLMEGFVAPHIGLRDDHQLLRCRKVEESAPGVRQSPRVWSSEAACRAASLPSRAALTFALLAPKSKGCQLSNAPPPLLQALRAVIGGNDRSGDAGDHSLRQEKAVDVVGGSAVCLPEKIRPGQVGCSRDIRPLPGPPFAALSAAWIAGYFALAVSITWAKVRAVFVPEPGQQRSAR